jgi:hypothetical protein
LAPARSSAARLPGFLSSWAWPEQDCSFIQASLLLIVESRIQLASVDEEMDFALCIGRHHAPPELLAEQRARRKWVSRILG